MHTVVGTASVHTTAAACDYLSSAGAGEEVTLVTVTEETAARDAGDAANVARTRLPGVAVASVAREGEPAAAIQGVAAEREAERIVVGNARGDPEVAGEPPGSTVRALLGAADRPVVVVPVAPLR
jgi:hypothetical protein